MGESWVKVGWQKLPTYSLVFLSFTPSLSLCWLSCLEFKFHAEILIIKAISVSVGVCVGVCELKSLCIFNLQINTRHVCRPTITTQTDCAVQWATWAYVCHGETLHLIKSSGTISLSISIFIIFCLLNASWNCYESARKVITFPKTFKKCISH